MRSITYFFIITTFSFSVKAQPRPLQKLTSPILFKGNEQVAYRDPAVLYDKGTFYLFFTYVRRESGKIYSYTALSHSRDLKNWSPVKIITPKGQEWDFSSPGNVIRFKNEWVLCLQTYPRLDYLAGQPPKFGNGNARLYIMRSKDLLNWSSPELLKVKGPEISFAQMGRMIDPYFIEDKTDKGKWWCFYKQNGISMSYSYDFRNWKYFGKTESGENPCVLYKNGEYILFYSPRNGIAIKKSTDLVHWNDWGKLITLGQQQWPWAQGRITAGAALDLTNDKNYHCYLLFFHGSGPLTEDQGDFDKNACIGVAWSPDLINWQWPGKPMGK